MRLPLGLLFSLVAACFVAGQDTKPVNAFERARSRASAERKLILLRFPATPGDVLPVFLDPTSKTGAGGVMSRYVELVASEQELAAIYRITEFPAIIVVLADGTEVDRLVGTFHEREISAMLTAAASGQSELQRLRGFVESEQSVESYGRLGDALVKRGYYAEALAAYRWCLEIGPSTDQAGYNRLLKVVVQHVSKLRPKTTAAGALIVEFQRKAESGLQTQDAGAYTRAFTFNEAAGDMARNGALFTQLPEHSALRCELYPLAFEGLVLARNYQAAVTTVDLEAFIGRLYPLHHVLGVSPHNQGAEARHTHRIAPEAHDRAINYTLLAVEAFLGVGKEEQARRLAGRLIDWCGKTDVRQRLADAAARGGETPAATRFKSWVVTYVAENVVLK